MVFLLQVSAIIGLFGGCRRSEMLNLEMSNIEEMEQCIRITLPLTKTKNPRVFVITVGGFDELNLVQIVKKYWSLRPEGCNHSRFFVQFRDGKCTRQPIGVNTLGDFPGRLAKFLKLPDAKSYTSHSFRRTSASLLADSGVETTILKRHGGWRSDKTAEGYVEQSLASKKNIAGRILGGETSEHVSATTARAATEARVPLNLPSTSSIHDPIPSTSAAKNCPDSIRPLNSVNFPIDFTTSSSSSTFVPNPIQFHHLSYCTINIHQK